MLTLQNFLNEQVSNCIKVSIKTCISSCKDKDILFIEVFYLVYRGWIGKICNLHHCKTYFHKLVHDFVVCFLVFSAATCYCYYQKKYFYSILFHSTFIGLASLCELAITTSLIF